MSKRSKVLDKEPDYEDERLRAWKMSIDDYDGDLDDKNTMIVDLGEGKQWQFFPTMISRNPKTKEAKFGIKIKHEVQQILYLYFEEHDNMLPFGVMKYLNPIIRALLDLGLEYEIVDVRKLAEHTFNKVVEEILDKDGSKN